MVLLKQNKIAHPFHVSGLKTCVGVVNYTVSWCTEMALFPVCPLLNSHVTHSRLFLTLRNDACGVYCLINVIVEIVMLLFVIIHVRWWKALSVVPVIKTFTSMFLLTLIRVNGFQLVFKLMYWWRCHYETRVVVIAGVTAYKQPIVPLETSMALKWDYVCCRSCAF